MNSNASFWAAVWCFVGLIFLAVLGVLVVSDKNHKVSCMVLTPQGPVQTIIFEDKNIREINGVIKGNEKLYRLGINEACIIMEIKK